MFNDINDRLRFVCRWVWTIYIDIEGAACIHLHSFTNLMALFCLGNFGLCIFFLYVCFAKGFTHFEDE